MSVVLVDIAPEDVLRVSKEGIELKVYLQFRTGRKARLKIVADRSIEVKHETPAVSIPQ